MDEMSLFEVVRNVYGVGFVVCFAWVFAYSDWLNGQAMDLARINLSEGVSRERQIQIAKLTDQANRLLRFSPFTVIFWPFILLAAFVLLILKNK